MSAPRIYLDNAATSFPKPPGVVEAVTEYLRDSGAALGRGAYATALSVQQRVTRLRRDLAGMFGVSSPERVIFTFNGTHSLNQAITGCLRPGDHVLAGPFEHNSVTRPLIALRDAGQISLTILPCGKNGMLDPGDIRQQRRPETRLVVVNHASNVTGTLQPISLLGRAARDEGLLFLVDAAQSAGSVPIHLESDHIDLLACPGHKGLLGPLGTGVLLLGRDVESKLQPLFRGGTGTQSESEHQPDSLPDKFESGNHNVPGLIGLAASVSWLQTDEARQRHETAHQLTQDLVRQLRELPDVTVYGWQPDTPQVDVIGFNIAGWEPQDLALVLNETAGIEVRAGLHCAPSAHRWLETLETGGTVRVSPGLFTTAEELATFLNVVRSIAETPLA